MKIRRISSSSAQETRNDQFLAYPLQPIRHSKEINPYTPIQLKSNFSSQEEQPRSSTTPNSIEDI
ncbi:hypothetical protein Tco_0275520, partial [Tanacetum coccineum]